MPIFKVPLKAKTKLLCHLKDASGILQMRLFHVLPFHKDTLKIGTRLRCYGDVRLGNRGFEMTHPDFLIIKEGSELPIEKNLTPIYPTTEGLHQGLLRKIILASLNFLNTISLTDHLPAHLLAELNYPSLTEAIKWIHYPPASVNQSQLMQQQTLAQQRIIFEELLVHRLSLLEQKKFHQNHRAVVLSPQAVTEERLLSTLPFLLTNAQRKVLQEITIDLAKSTPMLRLVQGDVGSGKTLVAAVAMLHVIKENFQAALMAPTELLAEQHYRVFKNWFSPLSIEVVLLTGSCKGVERKHTLAAIQSGQAAIVIGTHALFQDQVEFKNLALVVIDEQHRFGVAQRAMLRDKGCIDDLYPHQLVMTATPIPRTLAMSAYADLDVSTIDELPPGRTPITTTVISSKKRDKILERIYQACSAGKQAYWVCPLIEESEVLECQAAVRTAEVLTQNLPNLKLGLIHGRMKPREKEAVMQAFKQGEIHLLVATTVIEVGVDVPNASLMVIENAERMGLAQLHQLRGRVGRGSVASHCVLLYQYPISAIGKERLQIMRETNDGFKIAEKDLELRGPGEILGQRQTGEMIFKMADLNRDQHLFRKIESIATRLIEAEIAPKLIESWLGHKIAYLKV